MPKEIVHLRQFHGGINDASEATDIADHECQVADNCDLSSVGKITLSGDFNGDPTSDPADQASLTNAGVGLFAFRHDRDADGTNRTANYYATHNTNIVYVWDDVQETWTLITNSGSGSGEWSDNSGCDVNFLFHEGVLRQSDGQLVAGNQRRWWSYVNRTHFTGAANNGSDDISGMKAEDADIPTPSAGAIVSTPTYGANAVNFDHNIGGSGGSIPAATYRLGYSYVFDHHQEGGIYTLSNSITITAGQIFDDPILYFSNMPDRCAGVRIYIQRKDVTDDWTLLIDVHLEKGFRLGMNENYVNTFTGVAEDKVYLPLTSTDIGRLGPTTYKSINGYGFDEPIDCSYKTAVVVDGITYAGNILQNGTRYPDRVIKCAVVRDGIASDVFPESNFVDVTPNDGDEIVKLETFQDKVLVFKRKTLFVVNYSADIGDYLDATFPFMGVRHYGHTFPTAHGIVFMNDLGVHLYNGESVQTLTGKMQDMSIPAFTSTAGANDVPKYQNIGYDPLIYDRNIEQVEDQDQKDMRYTDADLNDDNKNNTTNNKKMK